MSERNNKLELLGSAPIPKALMALGVPIMIGMLINALYNLVDAYFVGGLGRSQMGAISIVFPLGQVVVGLGLMFGNGAASYLSRLLGRGDKDTANKVASTALYSSLLIGAIIILFSTIFLKPILTMLGATETIMPYALTYSRIYILSCVFNVFNVTMNNIVSSEGAAKTTMCALLLGAVLNIGLDPLFIYTFNMGVAGAAIATAISQMVSTLIYLTYVLRKRSAFSFSVKAFSPTGQMMAEILKIGIPTLVFQLLTSLSITLINRAASDYGDSVIAGMGAVTRITSMGTLVVFGFLKGFTYRQRACGRRFCRPAATGTKHFDPVLRTGYGRRRDRQPHRDVPQRRPAPQDKNTERVACKIDGAHAGRRLTRMKEPAYKGKEPLPLSVYVSARAGDPQAVERLLRYYDNYMNCLCTRTLYDEDGYPHLCVDEYMKRCLEIRLIQAIVKV